jgi:hypothetical protein
MLLCRPFTKSLFKSVGITVSHLFSMLPSTLKCIYSLEPVRMHFPAKQPRTNGTVCNAAMQTIYKESFQVRWDNSTPIFLHAAIYLEVSLFRWTSQNAFSREAAVYKWYCVQCCYADHLQRVFSNPLGWQYPTFSPCCHLPWSVSIPLNQSECIFPRNSRVQMILAALHTVSPLVTKG